MFQLGDPAERPSAMVKAAPPAIGIFLSWFWTVKMIDCPSGENAGKLPPSVPGMGRTSNWSDAQREIGRFSPIANATRDPSRETATGSKPGVLGNANLIRTTGFGVAVAGRSQSQSPPPAIKTAAVTNTYHGKRARLDGATS